MENQMSSSKKIDDAFKIIKNATGITDVGEVVQKFMTRETYYS